MEPTHIPQHPSLEIGRLRIPGPVVPSMLIFLPFVLPRRIRMRLLNTPLELLATALTSATRHPASILGPQTRTVIKCASVAIASMILQGAGWILSSFIYSCFRWRWFFLGQNSRPPALKVFSYFGGGILFFLVLALKKIITLLQAGGPFGSAYIFLQKELKDCLASTWWVSCIYLSLWLVLEINCYLG
jgi:hypothetical protein